MSSIDRKSRKKPSIRNKTKSFCIVCTKEYKDPSESIVIHKSRRQVHSMCEPCMEAYIKPKIKLVCDKLAVNKRTEATNHLEMCCPGSFRGEMRNYCSYNDMLSFNILGLKFSQGNPINKKLLDITLVLENDNMYMCPENKCRDVLDVDPAYFGTRLMCQTCMAEWCKNCLASPYHKGKTCFEHFVDQNDDEDTKYMKKLLEKGELKLCPGCDTHMLKNGGCNKMTCEVCGMKWCWLCNKAKIDYSHFHANTDSTCAGRLYE